MPKTYNEIYLNARKQLRELGIEAYNLEARLICAHAAGKTWETFLRDSRLYVTDDFEERVAAILFRREKGEPLAYITGSWSFYGLPVLVTPDVLIPRVDTEIAAREAIRLSKTFPGGARVLDLCTGSGCIGLAVAVNAPDSRIVMADKSAAALNVCRQNLLQNNVSSRAIAIEADALEPPPRLFGRFDIIVSNPPYIKRKELEELDPSVREYEPYLALDGGKDGLLFYRAITGGWKNLLHDGGYIIFECGVDQASGVKVILEACGFSDIETYKDTLYIDRVVVGRLRKNECSSDSPIRCV